MAKKNNNVKPVLLTANTKNTEKENDESYQDIGGGGLKEGVGQPF